MMSVSDPKSFQSFLEAERGIAAALVAAVSVTEFGKYYPDADVVIRWRRGKPLPEIEIKQKIATPGVMRERLT